MIKRTMYFYDKKQANVISKLNDNLHKQRGVRVSDDATDADVDKYKKMAQTEIQRVLNNKNKEIRELVEMRNNITLSKNMRELFDEINDIQAALPRYDRDKLKSILYDIRNKYL